MATYEALGVSDEWYTPPWVFRGLGFEFDLDAASPGADVVPWVPAKLHYTDRALERDWRGSVWLNPPYGGRNGIVPWIQKLTDHGNGIALVPNRTGADWWQDFAQQADAVLFVRGKIRFLRPDGTEGSSPGYGNVLLAYGRRMAGVLRSSALFGIRF